MYGFVEAVFICIFLLMGWKAGWSKAPKDERFCTVIGKSYELLDEGGEDENCSNKPCGSYCEEEEGVDNDEQSAAGEEKNVEGDEQR